MSIISRLTLPTLTGGIILLFASSAFAPPVQATSYHVDTVARAISDLNVRRNPTPEAERVGSIETKTWVWVERCVGAGSAADWCLVERAGVKGWVSSRQLTLHWE